MVSNANSSRTYATPDLLPIVVEIVFLTIVAKSSNKVWKL
ncbi:hypothetical protein RintRC_2050 [Richelia intracellularis]|nr:hypothetical protein RintRC_2050 [Richelia intracellularis]